MVEQDQPFLSIIVPFHNSVDKCRPLLDILTSISPDDDIELIFVDDGSTDRTGQMLRDFASISQVRPIIIERSNGGPGAARNSGLDRAQGRYVWFVDSDDLIDLRTVEIGRNAGWNYDVIAWDFHHPFPGIACRILPGEHDARTAPTSPGEFETIVAKWFSRDFLERTRLRFPENCVYEATPIENFVLPFLVETYFKSGFQAYEVVTGQSVTRGRDSLRRFDRLRTIVLGMEFARRAKLDTGLRSAFDAAFTRLFLWYSLRLSTLPDASWLTAMRVMRQYRDEAKRLGIVRNPFDLYEGRIHSRMVLRTLWALSYLLPSQLKHFKQIRAKAWTTGLTWEPPAMPLRWLQD